MTLTKNHLLTGAGTVLSLLLSWVGAVAMDVKDKADRVPALESQVDKTYNEIQVLRQQATESLIVLHTALGDVKRVAELRAELEKLKAEAAAALAAEKKKKEEKK